MFYGEKCMHVYMVLDWRLRIKIIFSTYHIFVVRMVFWTTFVYLCDDSCFYIWDITGIFLMWRHVNVEDYPGCNCWFLILSICRYGEMWCSVGIFEMFLENVYVLWTNVRRPPRAGVYGILCCIHRVRACELLKIIL